MKKGLKASFFMESSTEKRAAHHLLLVDDEPQTLKMLRALLSKKSPHTIDTAVDGLDALQKWSGQSYDLMIVDLTMPRMDGEHFLQKVRERDGDIPIIVMTGYGELEDAYRLLKSYGISDFLTKPLGNPMQLLFSVENALEKAQLRLELKQEIEAHQKVDDALNENRRMLMNLMSNLPGMVYRRQNDSHWSMEFVSEGCIELTGCQPDQLLSGVSRYSYLNLIHPEDRPEVLKNSRQSIGNKTAFRLTYRIITPDGQQKWVWEQGRGVNSDTGRLVAVEGFITDISRQKEAELELASALRAAEAASRTKSEFIAKMSHELRTPLNAIIGFSELSLATSEQKGTRSYTNYILVESKILLELINSLLDHAQIATGHFELDPKPFNLHRLMKELADTMKARAGKRNLAFGCHIGCEDPMIVEGDAARLNQILHNLLSNAIKFTETGSIRIELEILSETEAQWQVKVSIKDTGIGIPLERQPFIFEDSFPADLPSLSRHSSSGLGTTISKELVELMGGEIDFESVEREGSTFWIVVPLKKVLNPAVIDQVLSQQQLDDTIEVRNRWHARVLLAEDYKTNQVVAIKNLELAGCDVILAENGKEALEHYEASSFDLVLMDLNMPLMDGFAASSIIREREKKSGTHIPIVAYTANVYEEDKIKCWNAGMDDFLGKPIRQKQLFQILEKWLDPSLKTAAYQAEQPDAIANRQQDTGDAPMNTDQALEAFAGDGDTLHHVISEYFRTMEEQLSLIRQSIDSQNYDRVRSEAHSIKGGALTLAADDLATAALNLEKSGGAGDTEKMKGFLDQVEEQKQRLKAFYNHYRSLLDSSTE